MSEVLLIILILLPAVLNFILKSNAALGFLALCGSFAVITLSGSDIQHLIGQTKITSLTSNDIDLILLALPLLLTLLFTFKAVTSKQLRFMHLIPAVCAGALLAAVAAPMFSDALNTNITSSQVWKNLKDVQTYIVGLGLLSSLLLIWSSGFAHAKSHRKKHK